MSEIEHASEDALYDEYCSTCETWPPGHRVDCPECQPLIRASFSATSEDVAFVAEDICTPELVEEWESDGCYRRLIGERVLERRAREAAAAAAPKRKPLSKTVRFEVFKRDGFACVYCGATPPGALLECDHAHPVAKGGTNDIGNLVTACFDCNRGKGARSLTAVIPQSMPDRAAEVLEREAQIVGYQAVMKQRRMRIENDVRDVIDAFLQEYPYQGDGIPKRDAQSIARFIDKLGLDVCLDAVGRAGAKCRTYYSGFKYFCGICWSKVRDLEGGAP